MAEATDLQLSITAYTNGFTTGLKHAQDAARSAAQSMRRDLEGGLRGASEAGSSFEGKLKSLKGEMASGDRTINFFARSLNGLVPEASAAGQGLRLLADGLIGGIGLGFAIQGVMAVLTLFGDKLKETERKAQESAKAAKDAAETWYQLGVAFDAAMSKIGASKASWQRAQVEEATSATDKEIEEQEKKLRAINADLNQALRDRDDVGLFDNGAEERVLAALAEKRAITESIEDLRTLRESQRAAAQERAEQAAAGLTDASTASTFYAEERRVREQATAAAKTVAEAYRQATESLLAAGYASAENAAAKLRVVVGQTAPKDPGLYGIKNKNDLGPTAYSEVSFGGGTDVPGLEYSRDIAEGAKDLTAAAAAETEKLKANLAAAQPSLDALAQGFADMATGAKSAGQAIQGMAKAVIQTVLQLAMKQVTANAVVTSTEGAKAVAGTPIVGPFLAAGAMATMFALVMGQMSKLPSAAGGWLIPKGIDPILQAHGGERVIPARYADGLDRLVDGAAGGGGRNVTFQISTPDAESFYKMLKNRDSELFKVLNEGMRDRRFG